MPAESPRPSQRILLVTGLLGAGKTTALKVLEDLGWETIDNFPVRLLDRLLATKPSGGEDQAPGQRAPGEVGMQPHVRTLGAHPRR